MRDFCVRKMVEFVKKINRLEGKEIYKEIYKDSDKFENSGKYKTKRNKEIPCFGKCLKPRKIKEKYLE